MAVTERASQLAPYLEQILEDDEVRDNIRRAAAASRDAYGRARGRKKEKAARDPTIQKRLLEAAEAARTALVAIRKGPQKQQRRRRGRLFAALALAAGGAFLAVSTDARAKLLATFGGSAAGGTTAESA